MVAQRFNAGCAARCSARPIGTLEFATNFFAFQPCRSHERSVRAATPPLKRWAIIGRPSGRR